MNAVTYNVNVPLEKIIYTCRLCGEKNSIVEMMNIRDWEFGAGDVYEYRKCVKCNQIQLHPFPTLDVLKAAYPDDYCAYVSNAKGRGFLYNLLYKIVNYNRHKSLQKIIPKNAKLLDVGCGNGQFLSELCSLGATQLYGVDFNKKAIELARSKGIEGYEGVFLDYPHESNSFDVIFMNHYIEHVLEPKEELTKAYNLLKSGGYIVGELPNFSSLDRYIFGRFWGGNHVPRHTFQYNKTQLENLLKSVGFSKIEITYEFNSGEIVASIQNWLQRNVSDLRNNPALAQGRMRGFNFLLLLFLPLNSFFVLIKRAGIISFRARR